MSEDNNHTPAEPEEDQTQAVKEPVDKALLEKALADLQKMVAGNGLHPESITLDHFDGEVLHFEAYAAFKIEPAVSEKRVTGRVQGEVAGSNQEAHQKIKAAVEKLTLDRDVKKLTAMLLKKRRDMGFGVHDLVIPLKRYDKAFVVSEPCAPCNHTGKIMCQNCRGLRVTVCVECRGKKEMQCHRCNGSQFIQTPQGRQQCTECHGRGRIGCHMCRQTGEMPCTKCQATGKMPCHSCGASGYNSHVFQMEVKAKGRFVYDPAQIPADAAALIDSYGPRLITEGHGDVRIIEELYKERELDKISKPDEYLIPYEAKLPWGEIRFAVKNKALKGKLFGYNPAILDMPDFLERMLASGLGLVAGAVKNKGRIGSAIKKASRYRMIRDAFLLSARLSPKQALAALRQQYPYGISAQTLERLVTQSRQIISILVKKPRLYGLAAGGALAAFLYAAWFLGPLRQISLQNFPALEEAAADIAIFIIGIGTIAAAGCINTGRAFKKAFADLKAKNEGKKKLSLKTGENIAIAFAGGAALFLLVLYVTSLSGEAPGWFTAMTGRL